MVKKEIDEEVENNSFILFTKNSCMYCDHFKYILESIHESFERYNVTFYILNVKEEENRDLKEKLIGENGVPYAILLKDGETRTLKGLKTVLDIVGTIDELFG